MVFRQQNPLTSPLSLPWQSFLLEEHGGSSCWYLFEGMPWLLFFGSLEDYGMEAGGREKGKGCRWRACSEAESSSGFLDLGNCLPLTEALPCSSGLLSWLTKGGVAIRPFPSPDTWGGPFGFHWRCQGLNRLPLACNSCLRHWAVNLSSFLVCKAKIEPGPRF